MSCAATGSSKTQSGAPATVAFIHATDLRDGVPTSKYAEYRASRTSWGLDVLGSCIKIEASDGTTGFATGFGGPRLLDRIHAKYALCSAAVDI
ncbi:hypothetical protein C8R44DRAFT_878808 [Mycena epipterygia]|nr:hypothetical protein C8R44DRAFT_878808 [Mycena epipterygia]